MDKKTQIIAVAGKGGVGKTSLAGVIVKLLVEAHPDKKILAIDADPAVGRCYTRPVYDDFSDG